SMTLALRRHEMRDLGDHAAHGGRVLHDDRAADALEAEAPQREALARARADLASPQRDLHHLVAHTPRSPSDLPRGAASCRGGRSSRSAARVARPMLWGLFEPMHLVSTLATPASSTTARTPPPAITPVPSEAGRSITSPAPNRPITS